MRWWVLVFIFLVIFPVTATEFKFNQSLVTGIRLPFFDCDDAEILRYEDVPAEENLISEGISEIVSEEESDISEMREERDQVRSVTNSLTNKISSKTELPYETSKEDLKKFYKKNDFKVLGKTRNPCPGKFSIRTPDDPGFYYLPVKLHSAGKERLRYVGIEIVEVESKINFTNSTFVEVEKPKRNYLWAWFILVGLLSFLFGLIFKKSLRKVIHR